MRDILLPFTSKKKLLQLVVCILVFIGMAVPFKVMVLIEGFTEVRPVNAVPVVAGLLLGPVGAWGCAIGNLISDLFGTFSKASVLGFIGNFIAAYLPYKLWYILGKKEVPNVKSFKNIIKFVFISSVSAVVTAVIITCGLDAVFGMWMPQIFWIILFNDLGFPLVLGLPVFIILTSDEVKLEVFVPEGFNPDEDARKRFLKGYLPTALLVLSGTAMLVMIAYGMNISASYLMAFTGAVFLLSVASIAGANVNIR